MKPNESALRGSLAIVLTSIWIAPTAAASEVLGSNVRVSPIAMSANEAVLDVNTKTIERWAAATDLNAAQLQGFGIVETKLDRDAIQKILDSDPDRRARNFLDFVDSLLGPSQEKVSPTAWRSLADTEGFISDVANFGGLDSQRVDSFRQALKAASGTDSEAAKARAIAFKWITDARQGALRIVRGYKTLAELLRRELGGREFVRNVGLVVEIRTVDKQPTLSPLSLVTMECKSNKGSIPTLVFTQRKRDCNDFGVCRVESSAAVSTGSDYAAVFDQLQRNGRSYLDGCYLNTKMLVDGFEVTRKLPGAYVADTKPQSP